LRIYVVLLNFLKRMRKRIIITVVRFLPWERLSIWQEIWKSLHIIMNGHSMKLKERQEEIKHMKLPCGI